MNPSIIDTERAFTPEELYKAARFIEDAATITNLLVGVSMSEMETDSVMEFLSMSLSTAAEILTLSLEPSSRTFSDPAEIKKVS